MSRAALAELKDRNPVHEVVARWVTLRRRGRKFIGPCPLHSPNPHARDSTSFECDGYRWVCATCCDGGDVISLVQKVNGIDFRGAVEWLGGTRDIDPADAAKLERERAARRQAREDETRRFREKERRTLFDIWRQASPIPGTPAEAYLHRRRLEAPSGARLRCVLDMPLFANSANDAPVVHRAPAMVAAITGSDGRFAGLHITWIDLAQPSGKLKITDPRTGDSLPPKKVRGAKQCGVIELATVATPRQWIIGEGIETTLSVWLALRQVGVDSSATSFVSAIDLGNLAGRATETVRHPTFRTPSGRPQMVSGPLPDMSAPGIVIPECVEDVVLLGDGDSDPFLTRCAIYRASQRFARGGRTVRAAWAPPGQDFNDLIRGAA
jgi:CHC2 zinc finger